MPTLMIGLAAGALTAVAGNQTAFDVEGGADRSTLTLDLDGSMPLVTSLSLVVLAAWGVLLVTRGVVRRALAGLILLSAAGVTAAVFAAHRSIPDDLREQLRVAGITGASVGTTLWFWCAAGGAAVSVAAGLLAVRHARSWPEMGSRYDAPGATRHEEPESNVDLWKAFDEGRDPTA